jgi:phospholipase/carboxylesterase
VTPVCRWVFGALLLAACERTSSSEVAAKGIRAATDVTVVDLAPSSHAGGDTFLTPPKGLPASSLRVVRRTLGETDPSTPLAWIVAFHGLGDTPEGFAHLFDGLSLKAHVYFVQAPMKYGAGYDWFGARLLGDPAALAVGIQERLQDIERLVSVLALQPQNRGDAIVTGFSQGGILSYAVAVAGLPHVRATLPLAGWLPPSLAGSLPVLPVHAFHGENDAVVPFSGARHMVDTWQQRGKDENSLSLRTYTGVAHSVSHRMRRDWAARLEGLLR